jgi:chromosome partitioning protein
VLHTLAFLATKGGSGKSTLALHIGVAALEDRQRVLLVDCDSQASLQAWANVRKDEQPAVVAIGAGRIGQVQAAARADRLDLCIVDGAPHADAAATQLARAADLVVVPVRPNALDLAAVGAAIAIVEAAKVPAVFVLSACPPRAPEIEQTREALTATGFPVAPVVVHELRAFARAFANGRAVTEFNDAATAAAEIRALWRYLKGVMNGKGQGKRGRQVRAATRQDQHGADAEQG